MMLKTTPQGAPQGTRQSTPGTPPVVRTNSAGHTLRRFRPGDEAELVALAGRALAPYGGHVERSVEHWRWAILERPGLVPDADILVLEVARGGIRGHGVLGPDGTVLELFLDPELLGDEREAAARLMIQGLEARCRERGLEMIQLEQPRLDGRVRDALLEGGYRAEQSSSLQVILVDIAEAFRLILNHRQGRMPHGWRRRFLIELAPGNYRPRPTLTLGVTTEEDLVRVEENPPANAERDVTILTDLSCVTDLILRRANFNTALSEGRIAVRPPECEQDARTLCDFLGLKNPWYSPPADGR